MMLTISGNRTRHMLRLPIAVLIIVLITFNQVTARSQNGRIKPSLMQKLSDEQVVKMVASSKGEKATQAVEEIMRRGPHLIPLLMKNKGNEQPFTGWGLGDHQSADYIPVPTGDKKLDEGNVITLEVASLYIISALYYKTLEFAQSPYLTDLSLPPVERRTFNSRKLVEKAWASTEEWIKVLEIEGIEALRSKQLDPLKDSGVKFW